jgi:hypothetical protein
LIPALSLLAAKTEIPLDSPDLPEVLATIKMVSALEPSTTNTFFPFRTQ